MAGVHILLNMNKLDDLIAQHNWNLPSKCPTCGVDLYINSSHTIIKCANPNCVSKLLGKLMKWIQKLEIKEVSTATLERFIKEGYIKEGIADLYKLPYDKIKVLSGFGEKSTENIRKSVNKKKEIPLSLFISGFNIEDVGERVSDKIIKKIGATKIEDLFSKTSYHDFVTDGIGDLTANKFKEGLQANKHDMLETLKFIHIMEENKMGKKFENMSFCFTGAMQYPRKDLEKMVVDNGGTALSAVSSRLTYLVQQDPTSMSNKSKKAKDLGIKIISPEEFLQMVNS